MEKTVVALFDNLDAAQSAVQQLIDSGFSRDDISVVRTNQQDDYTSGNVVEGSEHDASGAAAGAGIGAVLGGLAGLLVGLGALAIPGIGPVIAAGPIATTLAGAGLGAATGGLVGALADAGIPEKDAGAYAEGVRRGGTLVTVRSDEEQVTKATEVLNRFTPVDINQRSGEWQPSSSSGFDANTGPYSTSSGAPHTHQAEEMAESKPASTDWSQSPDYRAETGFTGENSGGTYEGTGSAGYTGSGTTYRGEGSFTSNTERSHASEDIGSTSREDEDSVMRSGHGEMSTSQGFSGQGGGTYERMQSEDPTVHPRSSEGDYQARRDFLAGDQSATESQGAGNMIETGRGTYGSQGQNFQRSQTPSSEGQAREGQYGGHQGALAGGEGLTGDSSGGDMGTTGTTFRSGPAVGGSRRFEDVGPDFRSHWERNYRGEAGMNYGYERYQPAYQYGWQLGEQYQGRDWNDFEANARTDWERTHPDDAWQDFRAAIHEGWDRFKSGAQEMQHGSQGAEQPQKGVEQGAQDARNWSQDARDSLEQTYDRTMGDMSAGFDTYDRAFHSDWDRSFRSSGYGYERYQPAYQYGYNLATDVKYRSRNWSDIESDARRDWESRHPNDAWEEFKDAIHHAWDRVRGGVQDTLD